MIKNSTDTRRLFRFYTYDPTGRDVVIPIRGIDENDAWDTFDAMYRDREGNVAVVDQVLEILRA